MSDYEIGDSLTIQSSTINGGESFEARVLDCNEKGETLTVDPTNLDTVELAIVGWSEVRE